MGFLKWVGYVFVSIVGLCATVAVYLVLAAIGATIGVVALGLVAVVFTAYLVKDYFEHRDT